MRRNCVFQGPEAVLRRSELEEMDKQSSRPNKKVKKFEFSELEAKVNEQK